MKPLFGIFKGKQQADRTPSAESVHTQASVGDVGKVLQKKCEETRPDEKITVRLGSLLKRIPAECLAIGSHDPEMPVRFNSGDVLMHIARRRPYVSLEMVAGSIPSVVTGIPQKETMILFPWSEVGGQILERLIHMEIGSEILAEFSSYKNHPAGEKQPSKQLPAGVTHWYSNSIQIPRERKAALLKRVARLETPPSLEPGPDTTEAADEAIPESGGGAPSPAIEEPAPAVDASLLSTMTGERDEAVKQRDQVPAEVMAVEHSLEESIRLLETSQDFSTNKPAMESLILERDLAVKARDEALAELERVKLALRHTTEALEAVCKTSLKDEGAT